MKKLTFLVLYGVLTLSVARTQNVPATSKILQLHTVPAWADFNPDTFLETPTGKILQDLYEFTKPEFKEFLHANEQAIRDCPSFTLHLYRKKLLEDDIHPIHNETNILSDAEFFLMMVSLSPKESEGELGISMIEKDHGIFYIPLPYEDAVIFAHWSAVLQCWYAKPLGTPFGSALLYYFYKKKSCTQARN